METFLVIVLLLILFCLWGISGKLDNINYKLGSINTDAHSTEIYGIDDVVKKLDEISDHLSDISLNGVSAKDDSVRIHNIDDVVSKLEEIASHLDDISSKLDN